MHALQIACRKGCASISSPRVAQLEISDQNAFDARNSGAGSLIQADRVIGAIVELGRARRLVVRDLLRIFDCTTILQVHRNASCPGRYAGRWSAPVLLRPERGLDTPHPALVYAWPTVVRCPAVPTTP